MLVALVVVAATAVVAVPRTQPPAAAVPVATDDITYTAMGRVFPDPHGCVRGAPNTSPWAKGSVCATQFIQWDEAIGGLRYLQTRYPRFARLANLRTEKDRTAEFAGLDMQSAGLPQSDLSRARRDLYSFEVTDRDSPVPRAERKRFVYSLSIHGIERAGLEGGLRAAEDLVTWAATRPKQRILEPTDSGPTAAETLASSVIVFILSNPDGWHRGEATKGGVFFQRYNGNGMDLNRDFPGIGYVQQSYTPASEPETKAFMALVQRERNASSAKRLTGSIDLHGMLTAPSLSYTMLSPGRRDYRKNVLTVRTALGTYRDAVRRLAWSPYIAPADDCPGNIAVPFFSGETFPMCADQWGTVWDTINYQTTGSIGDYMDSPLGGDAVGITNEMALSHLLPNTAFEPNVEQLHIDGNKGLIFSQIATLLADEPVAYRPPGRIGFVAAPSRVTHPGAPEALRAATTSLPPQRPITITDPPNGGTEFIVDGPDKGVANGSLTVEATFSNAGGVSTGNMAEFILEHFGAPHAGDPVGWHEVGRAFRQESTYLHAGARIDLNDPAPGRYRIRPGFRTAVASVRVTFGAVPAIPVPPQQPYDVANTDFFTDLAGYVSGGPRPAALDPGAVLRAPASLDQFDSIVLADDPAPGVPDSRRGEWFAALRGFVERGGNLVLTDRAVTGLEALGVVPPGAVRRGVFYAGWMSFDDEQGPTYARHPLARDIDLEGTAEGSVSLGGTRYGQRRQVYESVALGYYVSPSGAGNSSCTSDRCDAPNWVVDPAAWKKAGGTTAARTYVREKETGTSTGFGGVSLGEVALGAGRVRIAGALLPQPTEKNFHPYGLEAYALTYTGYQVFENLVAWEPGTVRAAGLPATLPATGGEGPVFGLVAAALALAGLAGRRRVQASPAGGA